MNAYELADGIDNYLNSILYDAIHPIENILDESINMLRQQAKEIELMQKVIDKDTHIIEMLRMALASRNQIIDALDLK